MTRNEFKDAFLFGARTRGPVIPNDVSIDYLLDAYYDDQVRIRNLQDMIATMNDVAREHLHYVTCKRCGEDYDMPVELSEFNPDMSYCGKDEWCCP